MKKSYEDREYDITSYDPEWPNQFEEYAHAIKEIFGNTIPIEHIGSTAVPSMSGKPCIDILVIPNDLKIVEEHIDDMEQKGFEYAGQYVMENSLLFRIMKENVLVANIHFFPREHPHNKEMLDMRDYLRSHPNIVEEYSKLKRELYSKYPNDYASYRKYKDKYTNDLKKTSAQGLPLRRLSS